MRRPCASSRDLTRHCSTPADTRKPTGQLTGGLFCVPIPRLFGCSRSDACAREPAAETRRSNSGSDLALLCGELVEGIGVVLGRLEQGAVLGVASHHEGLPSDHVLVLTGEHTDVVDA